LERALSSFLGYSELVAPLARVLACASKAGKISYSELGNLIEDDPEDILLLGKEWRLLLPVRTSKSAAWEDRVLLPEIGEIYEMPNIVRYLVEIASQTGQWNPRHAIAKLFMTMGEPEWARISKLVEKMGEEAKDYKINAVQIKKICAEMGLGNKVDALIAELKGGGVMSPKLSSLAEVLRVGSPIYELNPSLSLKEEERDYRR
jgi:hypothetical protein